MLSWQQLIQKLVYEHELHVFPADHLTIHTVKNSNQILQTISDEQPVSKIIKIKLNQ